jgi:hypothetical protein
MLLFLFSPFAEIWVSGMVCASEGKEIWTPMQRKQKGQRFPGLIACK